MYDTINRMAGENDIAVIAERLKAIENIISEYVATISANQERERELKGSPQPVRAEITFDERSKREAQTEADRQYGTQNRISRAAVAAFVAALLVAAISLNQLYEMRAQTGLISQQSQQDNASAAFRAVESFRQLDIAQKQANAAQESVIAIQNQMRTDQRAWIYINFGIFRYPANEPIEVPFSMMNLGKTPARFIK